MTEKTHEAIVEDNASVQATTEEITETTAVEEVEGGTDTTLTETPEVEKPEEEPEKEEEKGEAEAEKSEEEPNGETDEQSKKIAEYERHFEEVDGILAVVFNERIATIQNESQRTYFENLEGSHLERMKEFEKMKAAGFIQFESATPKPNAQEHAEIGSIKLPAFPEKQPEPKRELSAYELISQALRNKK